MRRSEIDGCGQQAIGFLDFVEALAIRSLQVDYDVSLRTIREAIKAAQERYGINHPFARQDHRTVLIGRELHIFLKEDPKNPVGLTGKDSGQKSFKECIEDYMHSLEYDEQGMARLFTAFTMGEQRVVMNPRISFGAPIVLENGFTAETLWRATLAEGSFERAAEYFEVSTESVRAAYRYWNGSWGWLRDPPSQTSVR